MKMNQMIRGVLKDFEQYTSEVHFKKVNSNFNRVLKLDGNENLFIKPKAINTIIRSVLREIDTHIYTDTLCEDLRSSIAGHFKLNPDYVMVSNGADGVIDTIVKTYLDPSSESIVVEPTYSIYKFFVKIMGATYKPVLLEDDFSINPSKVLGEINEKTKLVFICSPNNPTGNQFQLEDVLKVLENRESIVILDEAYSEFGTYSLIPALRKYPNLIIIKTMSKAYGLASLRCGYCLADPEIIEQLLKVAPPYPVNIIAQKIVPKMLQAEKLVLHTINNIRKQRLYFMKELNAINGIEAYHSDANFILFRVTDQRLSGDSLHERLIRKGIITRNRSSLPLLSNCLRVTVCPPEMSEEFLSSLREIMG